MQHKSMVNFIENVILPQVKDTRDEGQKEYASCNGGDNVFANFERIRKIQDGLIERSKISSWPVVDISRVSSDLEKIEHHLDVAWNQSRS